MFFAKNRRLLSILSTGLSLFVLACSSGGEDDPGAATGGTAGSGGSAGSSGGAPSGGSGGTAQGGSAGSGGALPALPVDANRKRLNETIEKLSSDQMLGRLTGSASGALAEQAVLDYIKATGVEVSTQDVKFPLFEVDKPIELTIVDAQGAAVDTFKYIDDFREVDFSGSGKVNAPVVFAGYGLKTASIDSYAGLDVTGKIVAVLSGVPSGSGLLPEDDGRVDVKVDNAHQRGAVGVIFVPAGEDATMDAQRPGENEMWALDKYGDFDASLHHAALPVAFVHVSSTERLVGKKGPELQANPTGFDTGKSVRLEVRGTVHPQAVCKNILGVMPGQDPTLGHEVVILGAHYDHLGVGADGRIFNGAGDNASGTGIVLETATSLAASGIKPARTVLFAFWCAEEQGLRGSLYYGHYGKALFPLSETKLMIQVDYIGEKEGPYITNLDDKAIIKTFLGSSLEDAVLPVMPIDWMGGCASDDCIFLKKGVPAYRFIAYGDLHHAAEDDFANLDLDMIGRVADVTIRGVGAVAFPAP